MTGGNGYSTLLTFTKAPSRIVCLVPSVTESIFDLDAGEALVGVTDFCVLPAVMEEQVKRVGGTRTVDLDVITGLSPDLVIANQEENLKQVVEELEGAGMKVWVTFPRSVDEALQVLWALVKVLRLDERAVLKIRTLEAALEWTARAAHARPAMRVFCPIWRDELHAIGPWWMTFNQNTYCHDVLLHCGGFNIFADRTRAYPLLADLGLEEAEAAGERDTRYPRVTPAEVVERSPEVMLLPSEPYAFAADEEQEMKDLLAATPAVREGRICHVDGRLITWHGTRLASALAELPSILQPVDR